MLICVQIGMVRARISGCGVIYQFNIANLPPMFQDMTSLVVDIGTARARIGYGGDDAPLLMPHSLLATHPSQMQDAGHSPYALGDQQLFADRTDTQLASIFSKHGPEGYQFDQERLEAFLHHNLIGELGVDVKDYSILVSEDVAAKPAENREIREKVSEFLFERLNAANVFFMKAPVLACFATGRSSALVVDSGHNFTRSVAVHEGFCLNKSARVVAYGGKHVSLELEKLLTAKIGRPLANKYALSGGAYSSSFLEFHQLQLLGDIKEALSVRRQEEGAEAQQAAIDYELPDRNIISIQRKQLREGFLWGDEGTGFKGAASLATQTVNSCDVDVKKELYSNLLLTGGNMLYGSFIEELLARIGQAAPANVKVKPVSVCWPTERKYLGWIGGSIVTSLSSFQSYWVGNQEWRENGPAILDKKCT